MSDDSDKAVEAVRKIRRLLADWLRTSKDAREPVADILGWLETVDGYIRTSSMRASRISDGKRPSAGRDSVATYTIDKKRNEDEVLTEHRPGGSSQPFRCPKYLYEAVAKVLADADTAIDFDGLMDGLKRFRKDPAEFQVRAALRFMSSVTPPLIVRDRNKYQPAKDEKFEAEATAAWMALRKKAPFRRSETS